MMLSRTKRAIMWALTILLTLIVLCWVFYVAYVDFAINDANVKSEQYQKAYQQWSGSAAEGDTISQYRLGEMHEKGLGVPQNPVEAHVWYSLSTQGGLDAANGALQRLQARMLPEQIAEADKLLNSYANLLNNSAPPTALVPNSGQVQAQKTVVQTAAAPSINAAGQILASVNTQANSALPLTTNTTNLNQTDTIQAAINETDNQLLQAASNTATAVQQPSAVGAVVSGATTEQTTRALAQVAANSSSTAEPTSSADAPAIQPSTTTTATPQPATTQSVAVADSGTSPSLSVCEAQQMLTQLGFGVGVIDGIFGNQTANAISEYQRTSGLEVTGTIDRPFIASLLGLPWDGTAIRNYCVRIGA